MKYVREIFHVFYIMHEGKKHEHFPVRTGNVSRTFHGTTGKKITMNNFPYYRETFHGSTGNLKGPNISW
jgi:hypothetical protein